jgi:hypothetical protein
LLVKDIDKYLEYAAKHRQIKNIYITTNGTLLMSDDLIRVVKKYHKKVTIWISNYSANEELRPKLKHEKLLEQVKSTEADLVYNKDLSWSQTSELKAYHRTPQENAKYFQRCLHNCLAVFDGNLFVCPRAGVFYLKGLYQFGKDEHVSLSNGNKKALREQIIRFYSKNSFGACEFCDYLGDRALPRIKPAIQIKER